MVIQIAVFVKFSRKHKDTGEILEGKKALQYCIDCGIKAGEWVTEHMKHKPQDLEYEKNNPLCLFQRKDIQVIDNMKKP